MNNILTVFVDATAEMPAEMLMALTEFEFTAVSRGHRTTTAEQIKEFIEVEYSKELADQFHPFMMLSTRDS